MYYSIKGMELLGGEFPFEKRRSYGSVQIEMSSTQTPFKDELLKKKTFYGQPIASPSLSMQSPVSTHSANRENSQSFSLGMVGLGGYEGLDMQKSLGKPAPPLAVSLAEQIEPKFPLGKSGRMSGMKERPKSPKKGLMAELG